MKDLLYSFSFLGMLIIFLLAGTSEANWVDGTREDPFSNEKVPIVAAMLRNKADVGAVAVLCRSEKPHFVIAVTVEGFTLLSSPEPIFRLRVDRGLIREPVVVVNSVGYWFGYNAEQIVAEMRAGKKIFLRGASDLNQSEKIDFTFSTENFDQVLRQVMPSRCQ